MRRCDRSGAAVAFNSAWLAFTGRSPEASTGADWLVDVHWQDRARCTAIHAEMLSSKVAYCLDYRLDHVERGHRWVMEQSTPVRTIDGVFDGYAHYCLDVHERTELADTLAHRFGRLRAAVRQHGAFEVALAGELTWLPPSRAAAALGLMARLDHRAAAPTTLPMALSTWLDETARHACTALAADSVAVAVAPELAHREVHLGGGALLGAAVAHALVCAGLSDNPAAELELRAIATRAGVRVDLPGSGDASASVLLQHAVLQHGGATWVQGDGRIGFELPFGESSQARHCRNG